MQGWRFLDFLLSHIDREVALYPEEELKNLVEAASRSLSLADMKLLTGFLKNGGSKGHFPWKYEFKSRQIVKADKSSYPLEDFSIMAYTIFNPEAWEKERLVEKAAGNRRYRKNRVDPSKISRFTHRRVWWIDRKGHEWLASVSNRSAGNGCPYCAGRKVLSGFNDLVSGCPEITREWDYEKNGSLHPEDITGGSNKRVWWRCGEGHSWRTSVADRTIGGNSCPYCGNRKVWWKCENGHHWKSTINSRQKGAGCPYCHGLIPRTPHFIS